MKSIFDGIKLLGLQDHKGQWWKVVEDCARCGKCCMDVPPNWKLGLNEDLGGCRHLAEEDDKSGYRCLLGAYRPIGCCGNSPFSTVEYCSVKFEKITEDKAVELLLKAA